MAGRDAEFYKVTLKSWLYERIVENETSGHYLGLGWVDEEQRIFKLPWVTENDPSWESYYKLFYDWASRSGNSSTTPQKAKRNFRSALNHSKHFIHLKDWGQEMQTGSYKVYKFLTQQEMKSQKDTKQRNFSEESSCSQNMFTPDSQNYFMQGIYTASHATLGGIAALPNGQMLNNMNSEVQAFNPYQHQQPELMTPMNVQEQECATLHSATMDAEMTIIPSIHSLPSIGNDEAARGRLKELHITDDDLSTCALTIEYNGRKDRFRDVCLRPHCRIKYADGHAEKDDGSGDVLLNGVDRLQYPGLHKILDNMKRGIVFWYDPNTLSIYMSRQCLAHVYCFGMHDGEELQNGMQAQNPPGFPLQIAKCRPQPYRVFSYVQFLNEMGFRGCGIDVEHSMPSHTVEIAVGVQPKPNQRGKAMKGVKLLLQPVGATKILNYEDPTQENDVKVSLPDPQDAMLGSQMNRLHCT